MGKKNTKGHLSQIKEYLNNTTKGQLHYDTSTSTTVAGGSQMFTGLSGNSGSMGNPGLDGGTYYTASDGNYFTYNPDGTSQWLSPRNKVKGNLAARTSDFIAGQLIDIFTIGGDYSSFIEATTTAIGEDKDADPIEMVEHFNKLFTKLTDIYSKMGDLKSQIGDLNYPGGETAADYEKSCSVAIAVAFRVIPEKEYDVWKTNLAIPGEERKFIYGKYTNLKRMIEYFNSEDEGDKELGKGLFVNAILNGL